jgi:signal peptidase II
MAKSSDPVCACQCPLRNYAAFWGVAVGVLVADQASKYFISSLSGLEEGAYPPYGGWNVIPGLFSIVYNTNGGAAWGMFDGHGIVLAILAVVALAALYVFRHKLELERRSMQLVFGLIAGGIVGNLIDRVLVGRVTDFIDWHIGAHRWPTFNIADSCMVVGVCLYVLFGLLDARKNEADKQ